MVSNGIRVKDVALKIISLTGTLPGSLIRTNFFGG